MNRVGRMLRAAGSVLPVAAFLILGDVQQGAAGSPTDGSDRVVARVGDAAITVGELERRLSAISPYQLRTYGQSPNEIKRNFLERVLIPEFIFERGAIEQGVDKGPDVRARQHDLLKTSLLIRVREDLMAEARVQPEKVKAYYEENIKRYKTPARVSVWRILVGSREKAVDVIEAAKKTPTPQAWSELARNISLDKTTNMRGGNLGFLTEEGLSADGKTRVAASLAEAAFAVKDGEIVGEPVVEGSGFAVIWRRGSMPAINRTLEEERSTIEKILMREKVRSAQTELIDKLRKRYLTYENADGAELVDVSGGGRLELQPKPGRIVRRPGRTKPVQTPDGLR